MLSASRSFGRAPIPTLPFGIETRLELMYAESRADPILIVSAIVLSVAIFTVLPALPVPRFIVFALFPVPKLSAPVVPESMVKELAAAYKLLSSLVLQSSDASLFVKDILKYWVQDPHDFALYIINPEHRGSAAEHIFHKLMGSLKEQEIDRKTLLSQKQAERKMSQKKYAKQQDIQKCFDLLYQAPLLYVFLTNLIIKS